MKLAQSGTMPDIMLAMYAVYEAKSEGIGTLFPPLSSAYVCDRANIISPTTSA